VLAIASTSTSEYIFPSAETVNSNTYPIARDLYMYTGSDPEEVIMNYLEWILSPDAQTIVSELGFVPVIEQ
jgi:phosphate transport system substrate-binding protein